MVGVVQERCRITVCSVLVGLVAIVGCSDSDPLLGKRPLSEKQEPIYEGDPADAEDVGFVSLDIYNSNGDLCRFGSGIALTNDWVLTAAHVVNLQVGAPGDLGRVACPSGSPALIRVRMGTYAADYFFGVNEPDIVLAPGFNPKVEFNAGNDYALVHLPTPLPVRGQTSGFIRRLTDRRPADFALEQLTCYGYSRDDIADDPTDPLTTGGPRSGNFAAVQYPSFLAQNVPRSEDMFTVHRGGAIVPSSTAGDLIPVPGDSGGPCVLHAPYPDGDIYGILETVDKQQTEVQGVRTPDPRYANYTAAQGNMAFFARSILAVQAPPIVLDVNFDGAPDRFALRAPGGLIQIEAEVSQPGGSTELFTFLTPIPAGAFAGLFEGDFDGDGGGDVLLASVGGPPAYFRSSQSFDLVSNVRPLCAFSGPPCWDADLANPYLFFRIDDFNEDGVDDAEGVRADGTAETFLGAMGTGLTTPAHFHPRGLNLLGAPDEETLVIAAPGLGPAFDSPEGVVHVYVNDGDAFAPFWLTLDELSMDEAVQAEPDDRFGAALAWGNFDGSGDRGLVIGAPGATIEGFEDAGVVAYMMFGETADQLTNLDRGSLLGSNDTDATFGTSLAAGDFNGDGIDDIAVGSPGIGAGEVHIVYGSPGVGLDAANEHIVLEREDFLEDIGAGFGRRLTTGDFNCDGYEDLVIGATGASSGGFGNSGAVFVVYGSSTGLDADHVQRWDQTVDGIASSPGLFENFGAALAAGNFDGDQRNGRPCIDLAIGVPEEGRLPGVDFSGLGAVHLIYGGPAGLTADRSQFLRQGEGGILDEATPGDSFGSALALTRADLDRYDDLVIAAFDDNLKEGAVHVLRGSANGITTEGQAFFRQGLGAIPEIPEQIGDTPFGSSGDLFGRNVGGTSNGVLALGAAFEDRAPFGSPPGTSETADTGWVALIRLDDQADIGVSQVLELTEERASTPEYPIALREKAFFGHTITGPRPAFVAAAAAPQRWQGAFTLASAGASTRLRQCLFEGDQSPPVFEQITVTPDCLWPPNHRWVTYELGTDIVATVTDDCDRSPDVTIHSVQVVDASAGGLSDAVVRDEGVCVRASRLGRGAGRQYHVVLEARDAAGRTSQAAALITVPRNASGAQECLAPDSSRVRSQCPLLMPE